MACKFALSCQMLTSHIIFLVILVIATSGAYALGKLTFMGTLAGGIIATVLYLGFMFAGVTLLASFFILAVVATSWQKRNKKLSDFEQPEKRDAYQVLANGGVAGLMGLLNLYSPVYYPFFAVLMAAALASATADTLSSELGTIYGRRFYNVITLKPDEKGRDGVISLEGTLIGVAGSVIIALVFSCWAGWGWPALYIIIAGTAGNLFDSVLGATLERGGYIKNNAVNFLNTGFAAFIAWLLLLI